MSSRMEKYYDINNNNDSRTSKNINLYQKIYDNVEYTNVEGIASIEKSNEIDITKIKKMIQDCEMQKNEENIIVKKISLDRQKKVEEEVEIKSHDLKEYFDEAKKNRPKDDSSVYLEKQRYTIANNKLKDLNLSEITPESFISEEELRKLGDDELSFDMFNSLKLENNSNDDFQKKELSAHETDMEMDSSFYTASMKFTSDDFEELDGINKNLKKHNIWITLLVIMLIIIIIIGGIFIFNTILK